VKTEKVGDASITLPRSIDVGKKPVKVPVSIKSPASDYGTVVLTRGSKVVAATGGQVTKGSFGLLIRVPVKADPGKAQVRFDLVGHRNVKASIKLG